MTTIAYRAGFMAADSLVTGEGVKWGQTGKIALTEHGELVGAAGGGSDAAAFLTWARNRLPNQVGAAPIATRDIDGLLIDREGVIWCWVGGANLFRLEADYTAIGSGAKLAMGAMAMGASPVAAVGAAMRHDIYTGGRIVAVMHPRRDDWNLAAQTDTLRADTAFSPHEEVK